MAQSQTFLQHYAKFKFKALTTLPPEIIAKRQRTKYFIMGAFATVMVAGSTFAMGWTSVAVIFVLATIALAIGAGINSSNVTEYMLESWEASNDDQHNFQHEIKYKVYKEISPFKLGGNFFRVNKPNTRQFTNILTATDYPFIAGNFEYDIVTKDSDGKKETDHEVKPFVMVEYKTDLPYMLFINYPHASWLKVNTEFDKKISTKINNNDREQVLLLLNDGFLAKLYDLMTTNHNIGSIEISQNKIFIKWNQQFKFTSNPNKLRENRDNYDRAAVVVSTLIELFNDIGDKDDYKKDYRTEHKIRQKIIEHLEEK